MLDNLQGVEQQLSDIKQLVIQENYSDAADQVIQLQNQLQSLFGQLAHADAEQRQRLQKLVDEFFALLAALNDEQQKIKDSISQIAAVKSGNKISKTYQID